MSAHRVVWATDGSEQANRALQRAGELGVLGGATLTVVHSVDYLLAPGIKGDTPLHADEEDIKAKLREQVEMLEHEGLHTELRIVQPGAAGAARAIADVAEELDARLIIVGTRGHTPAVELLLGSVTQRLLHFAPCPVLAVPPNR